LNKYALISVSDKTNIVEFAKVLNESGYKIIATGSSAKHLKMNGLNIIEVSEFTSFPEIFGGRVKTLHPKIFGGILSRRENDTDIKEAKENVIENIDIGGPGMIRAAAKNYKWTLPLVNPETAAVTMILLPVVRDRKSMDAMPASAG